MSDEKIKAVLSRAAEDRTFFDALMANRESALGAFELSPEEKALLMAPTRAQLKKMIEQTRRRPLIRPGFVVGVGAALAVGAAIVLPVFQSAGSRPSWEMTARYMLKQIAAVESVYRQDFGTYGSLEDLTRNRYITLDGARTYSLTIEADADTYVATARHKTRPDTRPAFRVGPDGEVNPLE